MAKRWHLILVALILFQAVYAQQQSITIDANRQALNRVLVHLRDAYGFQFSFSDDQLSKYTITLKGTFQSQDEAMENVLKGLPFQTIKSGEVFVIVPIKETPSAKAFAAEAQLQAILKGKVVEAGTFEPLPFSHIIINNKAMVSDVGGNFSYLASADTTFQVKISHLGYYVHDTLVTAGMNRLFELQPANTSLAEVKVEHNTIEKSAIVGEQPGALQLNHYIARFIPGQGDNSVFNLLRLMPGILASGEQSSDLMIWGSYESHSMVTFDGFTVFGLKNFNDNIYVINPFMIKNIEVLKGGYPARFGDRAGAIVNLSGKNGNLQKPSFTVNINNTTINALVEIPLFQKSSLLFAIRRTYYNLYKSNDFNIFAPIPPQKPAQGNRPLRNLLFDLQLSPEVYSFGDQNLKYSYHFDNGAMFHLSLYGGRDRFELQGETKTEAAKNTPGQSPSQFLINVNSSEKYVQRGASALYTHPFQNGNTVNLIMSHSFYEKKESIRTESENLKNQRKRVDENGTIENDIREFSVRNENRFHVGKNLVLNAGAGYYSNKVAYVKNVMFNGSVDSVRVDSIVSKRINRFYSYLENEIRMGSSLGLNLGFRLIGVPSLGQFYAEPRISLEWKPAEHLTINASAGRYHQFVYKMTHIDRNNNYTQHWTGSANKRQVLASTHFTTGAVYRSKQFHANIEAYYKPVSGIVRSQFLPEYSRPMIWQGTARSYGVDVYARQEFGPHAVWASYTLGRSEEKLSLPTRQARVYTAAPHDQRHEIKLAGIARLWVFHVAANYVYGSGVELLKRIAEEQGADPAYSRFDASLTYRFQFKKISGETGISVLNLLNHQNVKYDNLKKIDIRDYGIFSIYTYAVPFTPSIFLQLKF
jgi:outer membrane receptor protein involved in Fe transport